MEGEVFFGNEQYYQSLKRGILAGDETVMAQLLNDVNSYARPKVLTWVGADDADDVLMELDCRLLTHIASYLNQSDDKTPYQRQAWLKTLLNHTLYDYLDQSRFGESYRTRKQHEAEGKTAVTAPPVSLEAWRESGGDLADVDSPEEDYLRHEESEVLNEIIESVCALRIGPAEVLTFLYHNVVFFLEGESEKKGYPAQTARRLEGKTLGELRDRLPDELERAAGCAVSPEVFSGLDQKLIGHRDDIYTFDAGKISASSSYSKKRVNERRKKNTQKKEG